MCKLPRLPASVTAFCLIPLLLPAPPATAQETTAETTSTTTAPRPTSGSDRSFLNFVEEGTIVDGQWWEGRLEIFDRENLDGLVVTGLAAFRLGQRVELGGMVGFGSTDSSVFPDGQGATDFDLYGKYYFGAISRTELVGGAIVTIPAGDNTAGLGQDAWRFGGFGGLRHRTRRVIYNGDLGVRFNSDAEFLGLPRVDGETSFWFGFGAIIPLSDRFSVVAETRWESERIENGDSLFSVLGGVNWRVGNRGQFRGAIDYGLDDGSPDWRVLAGYAHTFF